MSYGRLLNGDTAYIKHRSCLQLLIYVKLDLCLCLHEIKVPVYARQMR